MKRKIFGLLSIIIIASTTVLASNEVESRDELISLGKQFDSFEFHGYFRTGSDGNLDDSFKKVYDKNKNLIGRWGNEYDSFTAFNFSNTFRMQNGAWAKLFVELDNWNSSLDISSDINLASAKIEMGKIPGFAGAFEESVIIAGKQGWDNRAVDMTDYFYQDIDAVGLGINGVKLGKGSLGLSYLTAEFEDKTDRYYRPSLDNYPPYSEVKNIETSDSIRAIKATYGLGDFTVEGMYAHAPDHDSVKFLCEESEDETIYSRETADEGIYLALYHNPQNYYGKQGWGQHYIQYGTGLLGGSGLGRLNTAGNMLAHKDSEAFQIGTGGGMNLTEKLSIMTALRFIVADNVDAREYNVTDSVKSEYLKEQKELGFSIRPSYSINSSLDFWIEAGLAEVNSKMYNEKEEQKIIWKISAGPQLKLNFGVAETAVRAYVIYYNEDIEIKENGDKQKKKQDDIVAGFQMSVWW